MCLLFSSWDEIWKLRHLPKLKSLILSENPLSDIYYKPIKTKQVCDKPKATPDTRDEVDKESSKVGTEGSETVEEGADLANQISDDIKDTESDPDVEKVVDSSVNTEAIVDTSVDKGCELMQDKNEDINEQSEQVRDSADVHDNAENKGGLEDAGKQVDDIKQEESQIQDTQEMNKGNQDHQDETTQLEDKAKNKQETVEVPFVSLESLCVSETQIGKWKHLGALREFPSLSSVRAKVSYYLVCFKVTINSFLQSDQQFFLTK